MATAEFKRNPKSQVSQATGQDVSSELDGLNLTNVTPDDKPAPAGSRLADTKAALAIYHTLKKADSKSATERARIDGMFDGRPPFDPARLKQTRQEQKTNLNFGQAQRILDISLSAYVDLYSSLETFVEVFAKDTTLDDNVFEKQTVVAEELTTMLRSWPEFHSNYMRLCNTFVKHGVGIAYFDSPEGFRFQVGGFDDVLIPRQTPASEAAITVAIARRDYGVDDLFRFINQRETATKVGWNVDEVVRGIKKNVSTSGRGTISRGMYSTDYEEVQATIKNNDLYAGIQNPTVSVLHFWVRETDGTISHYMALEDGPKDWLFKKVSRFTSPEQAYIFFTNGVGSNGTYHSIRGLGQRIFAHIQTSDKLRCQAIDGAMMGSAVMLQPENQRALDELEFTYYGAYAIISPNVEIKEKAIPNMSQTVQPVLDDITDQLLQNTDTITAYGPDRGSPYRNQMQVASDLEITSRISGSNINLFYQSWERLMREWVRRVVEFKGRDPLVDQFYARCEARGVSKDFIQSLDLNRTEATRSVGNGSSANRVMVQKELAAISGQFDEVGQKNLVRDTVASLVGYKLADRYAPAPTRGDRETVDTKVAIMENADLLNGIGMPVLSSEYHGKHLRVHLPELQQLITGIDEGTVDPVAALPVLEVFYQHLNEHIQFAVTDPNLQPEVGQTRQLLQFTEEKINNGQKAQLKMVREEQQAQPDAEGPAQQPPEDIRVKQAQVQMEIAEMKAQQEMDLRERKFQQEQTLKDAEVAAKLRNDMLLAESKTVSGNNLIARPRK